MCWTQLSDTGWLVGSTPHFRLALPAMPMASTAWLAFVLLIVGISAWGFGVDAALPVHRTSRSDEPVLVHRTSRSAEPVLAKRNGRHDQPILGKPVLASSDHVSNAAFTGIVAGPAQVTSESKKAIKRYRHMHKYGCKDEMGGRAGAGATCACTLSSRAC